MRQDEDSPPGGLTSGGEVELVQGVQELPAVQVCE